MINIFAKFQTNFAFVPIHRKQKNPLCPILRLVVNQTGRKLARVYADIL